jgi:hypothetical protein
MKVVFKVGNIGPEFEHKGAATRTVRLDSESGFAKLNLPVAEANALSAGQSVDLQIGKAPEAVVPKPAPSPAKK